MPAVKKVKPINFIVKRDLIISALAVYGIEVQCYEFEKNPRALESEKHGFRSQLLEFKNQFYQKFKVDFNTVINNSVTLLMDKLEERIDVSQKDVSVLNKIYDESMGLLKKSEEQPLKLKGNSVNTIRKNFGIELRNDDSSQWLYKGFAYEVRGHHSEDEIRLLILEDFDKERRMFERLRAKFDDASSEGLNYERPRIPEKVRIEVWRRDGGKCARCGSREKLEYDHIVPISKGGSNTARNIELLCEKHNRSKSNNVI